MNAGNNGKGAISLKLMISLLVALLLVPLAAVGVQAAPGDVVLVSTNAGGLQGDANCQWPRMTPDGRYVAFQSSSTNLIPGVSGQQIYRKDLQTGEIRLVSARPGGTQGNNPSSYPDISSDGRYVVFYTQATNLITPNTTGTQVFRKDLETGEVRLVSANAGGAEGDALSYYPRISSDGRYVAFHSNATNLVTPATTGLQVFRKDMETGEVDLASADAGGTYGDGGAAYIPDITPDGRYVCFTSTSTNLVIPATSGQELFRKDLETGEIKLVSSDAAGLESNPSNGYPSCTPDGRYVSFASNANQPYPRSGRPAGLPQGPGYGGDRIRLRGRRGGAGDGRLVHVFVHLGGRTLRGLRAPLPPTSSPGSVGGEVYRKDLSTATIILVSADAGGTQGDNNSSFPSMDPEGRYVAFHSNSTNLVTPNTTNNQVFRKELALPVPTITSISPAKGPAGTEVTIQGQDFRGERMSGYVTFGAIQATEYTAWSEGEIKCLVPPGGTGPMDVWVTTAGGASNRVDFVVTRRPFTWPRATPGRASRSTCAWAMRGSLPWRSP